MTPSQRTAVQAGSAFLMLVFAVFAVIALVTGEWGTFVVDLVIAAGLFLVVESMSP